MKKKVTRKSEREIDELVIAQADNDSAWEDVPDRHLVEVTPDRVTFTALD